MKEKERGAHTSYRAQKEGQVRAPKKSERARGTDRLSNIEGETGQNSERKRASQGHSHPFERRGREEPVRSLMTAKMKRASHGHSLALAGKRRGTSQNTEKGKRTRGTHFL
jgi:hypothetical protein